MHGGSVAFFELAAQIIPVLFLAIMFELRIVGGPERPASDLFIAIVQVLILAIFVYGEARALHVVATAHPSTGAQQDVIGALIAGVLLLALYPLSDVVRMGRESLPVPLRKRAAAISWVVRGLLGVGLIALGLGLMVRAL